MASGTADSRWSKCVSRNLSLFPDVVLSLLASFSCFEPGGQREFILLEPYGLKDGIDGMN